MDKRSNLQLSELKVIPPKYEDFETFWLSKEDFSKALQLLFGTSPENLDAADLVKRIIEDKAIIQQKYGLPPFDMVKSNPEDLYRMLERRAKQEHVPLRANSEMEGFFSKRMSGAARLDHDGSMIAHKKMQDNDSLQSVKQKSVDLLHELIHALQAKKYPQMSIIRKEYEAYLSHTSEAAIEKNPWQLIDNLMNSVRPMEFDELWEKYRSSRSLTHIQARE